MSKSRPSISAASIGASRIWVSSPRRRIIGGYPMARCRSLPPAAINSSKRPSIRAISRASLSEEVPGLAQKTAGLFLRRLRGSLGRGRLSRDDRLELVGALGDGQGRGERDPPGAHQLGQRFVEPQDTEPPASLLKAGDLEGLAVPDQAPEGDRPGKELGRDDHPL